MRYCLQHKNNRQKKTLLPKLVGMKYDELWIPAYFMAWIATVYVPYVIAMRLYQ